MSKSCLALALALLVCVALARPMTAEAASSLVPTLPGLPFPPDFDMYAGYITVNASAGRALYYWLFMSERSPTEDPVVLWQTGGPGCSSLLAALSENGPFLINEEGTLGYNPFSWNNMATMIFVESPRNVGFSYSNTTSDNNVGDYETADDLVVFLEQIGTIYPQLVGLPLWLTGESYGGHYVPGLAYAIATVTTPFPFKLAGFLVGNAWTWMPVDNAGAINTWWTHAVVSYDTCQSLLKTCNLSWNGPFRYADGEQDESTSSSSSSGENCTQLMAQATAEMGDISIYDIYSDVGCFSGNDALSRYARFSPVHRLMADARDRARAKHAARSDGAKSKRDDPCVDAAITNYLNTPAVQAAIHAKPIVWSECSSSLNYEFNSIARSMIPEYSYLLNNTDIQILVYSGDVDAIVPFMGTLGWIQLLGRPVVKSWAPWADSNAQVGGYVTVFDRLTFATVRDAGHEVPMYQPSRAFTLFENFISIGNIPMY